MADVAEFVLNRLAGWGIERVYGYPGDGINAFLGAYEHVDAPRLVQTRHEEMAGFMACAHAKFTGQIGACMATSRPGAVHLANGLYDDPKLDHQPVIAVVGQQKRRSVGAHFQQEIDRQSFLVLEQMGVRTESVTGGCCGLAGSWGFEDGKWQISLDCGEQAFLPAARSAPTEAAVVANGFSCQTQLQQAPGTSREAMHLARVMALAREGKSTQAGRRDAGARPAPPLGTRLAVRLARHR